MEVLAGLAIVGGLFASKSEHTSTNYDKSDDNDNFEDNIYNNHGTRRNNDNFEKLAIKKTAESKLATKTGVIPKMYNQKPEHPIFEEFDPMVDQNTRTGFLVNSGKGDFLSQYAPLTFDNPTNPVSKNNVSDYTGQFSNMKSDEMFNKLAYDGGYSKFESNKDMRYGVTDDMTHTNMFPFFKSKNLMGSDENKEMKLADYSRWKIDNFTGTDTNPMYKHKVEEKPFFSPLMGIKNIYGDQVMSDFYQSRLIPSKNRQGEKPFQEVRVTPGLGLGYNDVGVHGFHDTYRAQEKNVDDLRTASNPKTTYRSKIVGGIMGEMGPVPSRVDKHNVLGFKEYSIDDLYPQKTEIGANRVNDHYEVENLATMNRGVKKTLHFNPEGFSGQVTTDEMKPKIEPPSRNNFTYGNPRNDWWTQASENRENTSTYRDIKMTQRMMKGKIGNLGQPSGGMEYVHDPRDLMKSTTRQTTEITRKTGNIGQTTGGMEYVHDPRDLMKSTTRQTTERTKKTGNIGQTTGGSEYVHDPNDVMKSTIRQTTERTKKTGNIGQTTGGMEYVHDPNDVMKTTIRQTTERTKKTGNIGQTTGGSEYVHDPKDVMKTTIRQITEKNKKINPAGFVNGGSEYVHDPKDVMRTTIRQLHGKIKRLNPANMTINDRSRMDANNMYQDEGKEAIEIVRGEVNPYHPNCGKYSPESCIRPPIFDFTAYSLLNHEQIDRTPVPSYPQLSTRQLPIAYTRRGVKLDEEVDDEMKHFNNYVKDGLLNNPFVVA